MAQDPQAVAAKWAQKMGQAGPAIQAGVQRVTVAPGQAAARQANVWAQNTAAAQAKYARNVAAVSLQDWQQAMIEKGANRVGSGALAAQPKMANAMQQLLPKIDSIVGSLPPRGDLGQNINRMVAFVQAMSQVQISK